MSRTESPYLVDIHGGIVILNSDNSGMRLGTWEGEEKKEKERMWQFACLFVRNLSPLCPTYTLF